MPEARYIFGVVEVNEPLSVACAGFGGEAVRLVGRGKLRAAVQRCQPDFLAGRPEAAVAEAVRVHHAVLQQLFWQMNTLVPIRFGTLVAGGDEMAAAWWAGARASLQPVLRRLGGGGVGAVTGSRPQPGSGPAGTSPAGGQRDTGTTFLLRRLQAEQLVAQGVREAAELRQVLVAGLSPRPLAVRLEAVRGQHTVARLSCLLRRSDLSAFERQLRESAGRLGLMVSQCDVLPPYSFVSQGGTAAAQFAGR